MPRRTVQKITPPRPHTFDQQFWPVIVALTVLCGIAIGAILTLLHGPWMWGSLLLLPAVSALALYLLFHVDDSKLRRSLQLAIILSLAAHLLILVLASAVQIFDNPFRQPQRKVARRQDRNILISDQRTQFVWQETNRRDTPEPDVQTEKQKQQETVTTSKPQPIPVENTTTEIQPQLVRRETAAPTIPHQDKSLSQLRRQTQNLQPKSSQQLTGQQSSATAKSTPEPTESSAAESVERQSVDNPLSDPQPKKSAASPSSTEAKTTAIADSSRRRANTAKQTSQSAPEPSKSVARSKKSTPDLPRAQHKVTLTPPNTTSTKKTAKSHPSVAATEITRRPTRSETVRPSLTHHSKTESSTQPQLASAAKRRPTQTQAPSISSPTSKLAQPRRSTSDAQIAASPIAIEKPAHQPDSSSASTELNSKTLSVSRSTAGVAGAGRSRNLETAVGGMTSTATQASAMSNRRETKSQPAENRMLATSQTSTTRRSSGAAPTPTSAFKADTTASAKISGSTTPTTQSVESSAARIDSASTKHRGEIAAEKGDTSVDLGPTKVVMDTTESIRRSGGGQPEVSQLNPESTRRSHSIDDQQPTLVADAGLDAVAPRSQSSARATADLEPNAESTSVARRGGEEPVTLQRDAATEAGAFSNQGVSDLVTELADSQQRAEHSDANGSPFNEDEEDEDETQLGNQRTRTAQAPVTRGDPGFGSADVDLGESIAAAESADDTPGESILANLQRQATAALPGSAIGRSATTLLLQAATALPVVDSAGPRRSKGRSTSSEAIAQTAGESLLAPQRTPTPSGSRRSTATPKLSNPALGTQPTSTAASGSESVYQIDASDAAIERADSPSSEQGAVMEIVAVEGPAGLGDLPDLALGVMALPASRESRQIQPDLDNRFRNTRFGGAPAINPDAVLAKEAFQQRTPAAIAGAAEPTTEAAIQLGLEFLARNQSPDGSWSLSKFDNDHPQHGSQLNSDTAATGLALLAFQGAGYNHREFKYARTVNHAIQWLVEHQADDGGLYVAADQKSDAACRLYSHGIAALALTEAYGMTQDLQLKFSAQKALDYIATSQDPRKGGWRYYDDPKFKSSDTSVSGWMMMALQSGRLTGLNVNPKIFRGIDQWLDTAAEPDDPSQYRYNPYAVDSAGVSRIQGRRASPSMTSVGLLMRIYQGWDRNDSRILDGAAYLIQEQMPSDASPRVRDTYYWYYATQVLKHIDGPLWEKWDAQLRPLLIQSQTKTGDLAGSWHPYNPVPDRWGAFGGRLYVTTMNLLSLEVRHRMLPLYQKTNKE